MALVYKSIQSPMNNKEGQKPFHPRVVYTGNVSTEQLAKEVAAYSSLSPGDVKNTIDNLVTVMTQHLQSSEIVSLKGLGSFRLILRSQGEGFAEADQVTAAHSRISVRFTPSQTRNVDGTVATRSLITGVKCISWKKFVSGDTSDADTDTDSGSTDSGDNPLV
ncbi:MAG: HU family DNA-binding protein [Bacteroides sp.]|nr:HU family DNA-binding protein [Bacteroides sp.]